MFDFLKKKIRCPYCRVVIEKEHKGKFKCPSCKGEIHIRKTGGKIKLLTKDERERLNAERKEQAEKNKYFIFFQDFIDDKEYLEDKRVEWLKKFPYRGNYNDLTWSFAHEILQAYMEHREFQKASSLYFSLARFQFEHYEPFFHLLHEGKRMALYDYKYTPAFDGIKLEVCVITCGEQSCPACRELNGKWFTVDAALEQMPIPVINCTNEGGWCRCCYGAKVVE